MMLDPQGPLTAEPSPDTKESTSPDPPAMQTLSINVASVVIEKETSTHHVSDSTDTIASPQSESRPSPILNSDRYAGEGIVYRGSLVCLLGTIAFLRCPAHVIRRNCHPGIMA